MRLIDANALKRRAQKVATESWKMKIKADVETILNQFIDWINGAETIEKRENGKWIEKGVNKDGTHNICCSVCSAGFKSRGHANSIYTKERFVFCPKCGADMKHKEKSEDS